MCTCCHCGSNKKERLLYFSRDFGIMGVVDALKIYKKAKKAINEVAELAREADVVLMIDSPAFNIPLAERIKEIGVKTPIFYYILPQVWAWKKKRVKKVEAVCDRLFTIFPFEDDYWNNAEYVGNPLVDQLTTKKTELTKNNITAFLPGSRKGEIKKLMPIYKEVAQDLDGEKLLVIPKFFNKEKIEELYGDLNGFTVSHDTEEALSSASQAVVCSGTATLESAIIGTPFVLVYKAKPLDYAIGRSFVRLPYVGIANLIFYFDKQEALHKELLQGAVTKENILRSLKDLDKEKFIKKSVELRLKLRKDGASKKIAEYIKEL
ncbi:MAG: lipid-A-disaccharide synthase [Campylobacterales bacterium]|nr:lipid-A-disaccharide synthase [Campylobacterales bacterium]